MVAVPVSHFSASPEKGFLLGGDRFLNSESVLSNRIANCMVGLQDL